MSTQRVGPSLNFGVEMVARVLQARGISNPDGVISQLVGGALVEQVRRMSDSCANFDELAAQVDALERKILSHPGDQSRFIETSKRMKEAYEEVEMEGLSVERFGHQVEKKMIQVLQDVQDETSMSKCGNPTCSAREKNVLRKCRGCFKMAYCGDICQKAHWSQHKVRCLHLHKKQGS